MPRQKSLYLEIADYIKNMIDVEGLSDGTPLPTQVDLAKKFNTTRMTVLAAYRHLGYEGMVVREKGKGTFVRLRQDYTRAKKKISMAWGVVIQKVTSYAWSAVTHGIMDVADANNYLMILCSYNYEPSREISYIDRLIDSNVDGVIIRPGAYVKPDKMHYENIRQKGIPVVFLHEAPIPGPLVATNHKRSGYICTRHLLENGCQHIIYCGLEKVHAPVLDIEGFRQALEESGFPFHPERTLRRGVLNTAYEIRKTLQEYIAINGLPDGIVCFNDRVACEVYKEVHEHNAHVPQEVSIICCEDGPYAVNNVCPISGAVFNKYDEGYSAGMLLKEMIDKGEITNEQKIVIEPRLVLRESCGKISKWEELVTPEPVLSKNW